MGPIVTGLRESLSKNEQHVEKKENVERERNFLYEFREMPFLPFFCCVYILFNSMDYDVIFIIPQLFTLVFCLQQTHTTY